MSEYNSKRAAVSGLIWKFLEKSFSHSITLIVTVILARLLTPADYSVVGLISIFFTFCEVFISGGFNTALIQKKDADMIDFSSVLWISLGVAAIVYTGMYFCAPAIAGLYDNTLLIPMIRIMGITFFFSAVKSVIYAYVSRNLQFRKFFFSTLAGTIFSATLGITLAIKGFGAWALVAQQMSAAFVEMVILWIITKLKFKFKLSWDRVRSLFSYGWKIFATSVLDMIYMQIRPLIVGIQFSAVELAYYTKGRTLPQFLNATVNDNISAVLFPILSKVQDDKNNINLMVRRFMQMTSFIIFPVLLGLFAISESFVIVFLTEKWLPSVAYIKIFSVSYLLYIMQLGNLQAIKAIGRSDLSLKLGIVKKSISFLMVFLFVIFFKNPYALAISEVLCGIISYIINTMPTKKLFNYGVKEQIVDVLPGFICAVIMTVGVCAIGMISLPAPAVLIVQILSGIAIYLVSSLVFARNILKYALDIIKGITKK